MFFFIKRGLADQGSEQDRRVGPRLRHGARQAEERGKMYQP